MGGAIALSFGRMHPDRTLGLVLIASGARLRVAPQLLNLLQSDLPAAVELISRLEWGPNTPPPIVELGKQQLMACPREVIYNGFRACNTFDLIEHLNAISAPALIVSGTLDQLTPIKYAAFMAERMPHARLVSVPDAGHMVMIEAAAIVACEVEQFVRELTQAAASHLDTAPQGN
jgi:pimeloyl-ACP methyl ester carboxylesterase